MDLKKLADHKHDKTAEIYAKSGTDQRIKMIKDVLKVPNLTV